MPFASYLRAQRGGSSAKEARAERKRKRKAQQGASLAPFAEEPQQQQQSMPTEAQVFEGRIVTILALLFVLCLAEGLAVAGSVRASMPRRLSV